MYTTFKEFINESKQTDFEKISQMLGSVDSKSQKLGQNMLESLIGFDFSNFKIEDLIKKNFECIEKHNIGIGVFFSTKTGVFKNADDYLSDILEHIDNTDKDKTKPLVSWWDIKHDTLLIIANTPQGLKYTQWEERYEYDSNVGDEVRTMSFPEKGSFELDSFEDVNDYNIHQMNDLIRDREIFIKIYL